MLSLVSKQKVTVLEKLSEMKWGTNFEKKSKREPILIWVKQDRGIKYNWS